MTKTRKETIEAWIEEAVAIAQVEIGAMNFTPGQRIGLALILERLADSLDSAVGRKPPS
jgi:hypothetical protein